MPQPGRTLPKRLTTTRVRACNGCTSCSPTLLGINPKSFAEVMGWPSAGELQTFLSEGVKEGGEH